MRLLPITKYDLMKRALIGSLFLWAATASLVALRSKPQFILVLQDESGVRRMLNEKEFALIQQRSFIENKFLPALYDYSASNYDQVANQVKSLMTPKLREERSKEFERRLKELKNKEYSQHIYKNVIEDIRSVDTNEFEIDLTVSKKDGLVDSLAKYRINVSLAPKGMTEDQLDAWAVASFSESERN